MAGKFAASALSQVLEDFYWALEQGGEVCIVFFDMSKAFDTVSQMPPSKKVYHSVCMCVNVWVQPAVQ